MYEYQDVFIGGTWRRSQGGESIKVVSPHSEEVIGQAVLASELDIDAGVGAARSAFDSGSWAETSPVDRIDLVEQLAAAYQTRIPDISTVISEEMGSPISFAQLAQGPAAWLSFNSMIEFAKNLAWEERRPGFMGGEFVVRREPVGVVGAIVPWNFPQGLLTPKLGAALLAGCTIVIKPSPETVLDAMILAEIIEQTDIPPGVVSILPADREVGEHLVRHPDVDKIAFTGSTAAGRKIGAICGEQLKRVSLELGGKSAAILLEDVDMAAAISGLKVASLMNNGQICAAQTRILAPESRYDEFVDGFTEMVRELKVGDPADPETEIGPLASQRQQKRVADYITLGEAEGAMPTVGGPGLPAGQSTGWYVRPTVFAKATNSMRIAQEEIFGPVITVIPYRDEREAIDLANESIYGLAGSVWTTDEERGMDIARKVRSGTYGINLYSSDINSPFGGYKASGIGREGGIEGLSSYLEYKSIVTPGAGIDLG